MWMFYYPIYFEYLPPINHSSNIFHNQLITYYVLIHYIPLIDQCKKLINILIIGDMNLQIENINLKSFMEKYNLYSLIKTPTCFKSKTNPSCIDLILTNRKCNFQKSHAFVTGLSDFHNNGLYYDEIN